VKVLFLSPAPTKLHMGGFTTVARYRDGLQQLGHVCELHGADGDGGQQQALIDAIGRFQPDIVHAHDVRRCGVQLLGSRTPWVISVSGEDLHQDVIDSEHGPIVCEVMRRARRVLVPSEHAAELVAARVPGAASKVDVVARAATSLPTDGTDLRRSLGIQRQRFLVFLPGGIRPVKAQHRAISAIPKLRAAGADIEMIIAGAVQDEDYARKLQAEVDDTTGVRLMPSLARERMGAAYADADVVLNTSVFEGAAPTILEAGMLGRPVIASDVPGNRALIRHKETGLLFGDEESLAKQILALYRNRTAAGTLGVRVREDFMRRFSADREVAGLLSAYAAA